MSNAAAVVVGRHRAPGSTISPAHKVWHVGQVRHLSPVPQGRKPVRRIVSMLTSVVLLVCAVAFALIAVGPHLVGYRTSTMLTGSMEPGISPGDVVVTAPRPTADVQVGDVITYHIPIEDQRVETHRVTQVVHNDDGTVAVRTKGDANANVDPWTATLKGETVWEVQAVVPKVGNVIRVLRWPAVRNGVLWVAIAGLLLLGMSIIWSGRDPENDS